MYNPQRRRVKTASRMWCKKGDLRRIILLPMTIKDVCPQEHQGGQGDEWQGRPWTVRIPIVFTVPAHHICIARCGPSCALGGLPVPHRMK